MRVRAWLLPALDDGDEADLIADLTTGMAQLWPGERAAMVTQLLRSTDGSGLDEVRCWLAGGDMDDVLALRPGIEAWARQQGCTWATVDGRHGWTRSLRKHGYRDDDGELRKAL